MTASYKVLSLLLVLSFQGCNLWDYLKTPERQPEPPQGNRAEARELLNSYLNARLAGESEENLRAYLTAEAWHDYQGGNLTLRAANEEEFVGYKVMEEADLTEGRFGFTTSLQLVERERPYTVNLTEDLIVSFSDDEYRVSTARLVKTEELRGAGTELIWAGREKEEKKEIRLFNLEDFPARLRPLDGATELETGRAGYTTLVLNPEGRRAAFGTTGTHGALGILSWTGETPGSGDVQLTPVDVYYGEHPILLAFSPDSRYLAVEIRSTAGTDRVEVYQAGEKNKLNFGLDQAFPAGKYNVSFRQWEPESNALLIRVSAGVQPAGDEAKMGTWRVNILTGEREKVIGG